MADAYKCDRCGRYVDTDYRYVANVSTEYSCRITAATHIGISRTRDLCEQCCHSFDEWLSEEQ